MTREIKVTGRTLAFSKDVLAKSPELQKALGVKPAPTEKEIAAWFKTEAQKPKQIKPRLNKTEIRFRDILIAEQCSPVLEQAITLRLDPPYRSYTPDLAYLRDAALTLVEVKGPHRFREKGIAKAALAAKTYPMFRFELADWDGKQWKRTVLTP